MQMIHIYFLIPIDFKKSLNISTKYMYINQ